MADKQIKQPGQIAQQAVEAGKGVVRLAPVWVPRKGSIPGRRLRLHPDDLYALGVQRGGMSERWLASTTHANNGPTTPPDEGLSYVVIGDQKVTLLDALNSMGETFLGKQQMDEYGDLVMFGKLFDYMYPIALHMHQDDAQAAKIGARGKPEAYFFPSQYNPTTYNHAYTYFGLLPGTTKGQVIDCLKRWNEGSTADNGILDLSRAYKLTPGTGWYVPPLILHAPGTFCTYEPQRASDVGSMYQSLIADVLTIDRGALWRDMPKDKWGDYEYAVESLDWAANVDSEFKEHHLLTPRSAHDPHAAPQQGYTENWITYANPYFSAKELTIQPGRTVVSKDAIAYGAICIQGYGRLGTLSLSAPGMVRYGQMTEDEFFVTIGAANAGVTITNLSSSEPLVLLKHFNPGNPEAPQS